jgi:hypothetical protein
MLHEGVQEGMKHDAFKNFLVVGLVTLAGLLILLGLILPALAKPKRRIPLPIQREHQRQIVYERIHAAGGWEFLRRECEALFADRRRALHWRPPARYETASGAITNVDYGPLPSVLASLQPREIWAVSSDPAVVRIHVFGYQRTGGGVPYYDLYIVCGPAPDNYVPPLEFIGATNIFLGEMRRITNSVFESY